MFQANYQQQNSTIRNICCRTTAVCCRTTVVGCQTTAVCCRTTAVYCRTTAVCCRTTAVCCQTTAVCRQTTAVCCRTTAVSCRRTDTRYNSIVEQKFTDLFLNCTNNYDKARPLAASAKLGADWLKALPLTACELHIADEAIRIAISLRLGLYISASLIYVSVEPQMT